MTWGWPCDICGSKQWAGTEMWSTPHGDQRLQWCHSCEPLVRRYGARSVRERLLRLGGVPSLQRRRLLDSDDLADDPDLA